MVFPIFQKSIELWWFVGEKWSTFRFLSTKGVIFEKNHDFFQLKTLVSVKKLQELNQILYALFSRF